MFLGSKITVNDDGSEEVKFDKKLMCGAQFTTAILVEQTDRYTVEFWFKAMPGALAGESSPDKNCDETPPEEDKNITFLYNM